MTNLPYLWYFCTMLKLNLGCGLNKLAGFVNVDRAPECAPDLVFDIEQPDWPWADNSVTEVIFNHALEHIGRETDVFLRVMQELYRVCAHGATVAVNVPHPRHDNFLNDPTHVRAITPALLDLFDRRKNEEWAKTGGANTPLALYLSVDFVLTKSGATLAPRYQKMLDTGEITRADLDRLAEERNNVIEEYRLVITARKERQLRRHPGIHSQDPE